jgi:glycerol uptake facilitator-like aquaporin
MLIIVDPPYVCLTGFENDAGLLIMPLFMGIIQLFIPRKCVICKATNGRGWGRAALPDQGLGFLTIYVFGPIAGAVLAALVFTCLLEPLMKGKQGVDDG